MKEKYYSLIYRNLHLVIILLMGISALYIYDDYGIAWDDPEQREIGYASYNYLFHNDKSLAEYRNRHYGVVIELPLIMLEKALNLADSRDIFLMRHLSLHLFFLLGIYFFYKLIKRLFENEVLAILGMLMLYFSPVLLAHSFANSKDIPLMVFIIISLFTLLQFYQKKTYKTLIIHALVSALAVNTRIMGLIIPMLTLLTFIPILFSNKAIFIKELKLILSYSLVFSLFFFISNPPMWFSPFSHLYHTFARMSNFPWRYETLYLGEMISAQEIPWHYSIVWISITTPLFYLALIVLGYFLLYKKVFSNLENLISDKKLLFIGFISDIPILIIIVLILLNSTLYDGWRHIFFLYPFLLLMAIYGLNELILFSKNYARQIYVLSFILLGMIAIKTVELHPYEQVYFNRLVPQKEENIRKTMEMDYWGMSYKNALEYILKTDPSKNIKVKFHNYPGEANLLILNKKDRERIMLTKNDDWDYFISNFRQHPEEYPYPNVYSRIKRQGSTINITYRK